MSKHLFDFRYVIGKGGFGKVWKVVFKKTQKVYALKEMLKVRIIDKKSEHSIKTERLILSKLHHPYIYILYHTNNNMYIYITHIVSL